MQNIWFKSCIECSRRMSPRNPIKAPLLPIPVGGAFYRVAIAVLGPFPPSNKGSRYIAVLRDRSYVDGGRQEYVGKIKISVRPPLQAM